MKKQQLQILLSRLEPLPNPEAGWEQYQTPPDIAAATLHIARMHGHLNGVMVDLGCGNGILTIGAALLNCTARGYDIDPDAVETARRNATTFADRDLDVTFFEQDVTTVDTEAEVVVMNPPFGVQEEDANLPFLKTAFATAPVTYALLHHSPEKGAETRGFIKDFASQHGMDAAVVETFAFPLPRTQDFHTEEERTIGVDCYRFTQVDTEWN